METQPSVLGDGYRYLPTPNSIAKRATECMWTAIAILVGLFLAAALIEGIGLACFDYLTHGSISKPPDAEDRILTSTGELIFFVLASIPTVLVPIGLAIRLVSNQSHSLDSLKASLESDRLWLVGGFFLSSILFVVFSLLVSLSKNVRRVALKTNEDRGQFRVTPIVIFYSVIGSILFLIWFVPFSR